jgi:hypothetical protein
MAACWHVKGLFPSCFWNRILCDFILRDFVYLDCQTQPLLFSSLVLIVEFFCCVYLDAVEVFGTFILAQSGVKLFRRYFWLKYTFGFNLPGQKGLED